VTGILGFMRDAASVVWRVVQQSVLSLRYNWGLGLLSLALAVSLWVFVTERENPTRTETVAGTIEVEAVNVPPDRAVTSINPSSVRVRVSASESVLEDLGAEDFRATVDLSDATAQEVTVEVQVETTADRVEIEGSVPLSVDVVLENVASRTVPVEAQPVGQLPLGFEFGELTVEPAEARVTGPESLIDDVDVLAAEISLTGVRTDIEQTVPLQPRSEGGTLIEGLSIEPEDATVGLEVIQTDFTIFTRVTPEITGQLAPGHNVTGVQVDPLFVSISGPIEALEAIDQVAGVPTEEVSIDGARDDVTRTVALRLPDGTRSDRPTVTVTVAIEPQVGQFAFSVAPRVTNLSPGLVADLSQTTVEVQLAGSYETLNALSAEDIGATLDLGGLGIGTHSVAPQVQPPPDTFVVGVTPPRIDVTIRQQ
jgi:YbbR domain-containing protein